MMKTIGWLLPAFFLFSGCTSSSEEMQPGQEQVPIRYAAEEDFHPATRATTALPQSQTFVVWAYNGSQTVISGETASSTDGVVWNTSQKHYWPANGATLDFYAYSPATSPYNGRQFVFTSTAPVSGTTDLIYATATGSRTYAAQPLSFSHALAQVQFVVKTEPGITASVAAIKLQNVSTTGTFNFSSWSSLGAANQTVSASIGSPVYLIPQTLGSNCKAVITCRSDDSLGHNIINGDREIAISGQLTAGSCYTYTLLFSPMGITIETSIFWWYDNTYDDETFDIYI